MPSICFWRKRACNLTVLRFVNKFKNYDKFMHLIPLRLGTLKREPNPVSERSWLEFNLQVALGERPQGNQVRSPKNLFPNARM